MSSLPAGFRHSQSSLACFGACARRFWLRYAERLDWPAPHSQQDAAREAAMQRGRQFHRLAQQHALGLDVAPVVEAAGSDLQRWWQRYLDAPPAVPDGRVFSELEISAAVGGACVTAVFDRLACGANGRFVIVDWKTGQQRPDRDRLASSWQTIVYPFVLVEGGRSLNGGAAIAPEQVALVYWFAEHPDAPVRFDYDAAAHERARSRLATALERIRAREGRADFAKTDDHAACRRCVYRAYCQRAAAPAAAPATDAAAEGFQHTEPDGAAMRP